MCSILLMPCSSWTFVGHAILDSESALWPCFGGLLPMSTFDTFANSSQSVSVCVGRLLVMCSILLMFCSPWILIGQLFGMASLCFCHVFVGCCVQTTADTLQTLPIDSSLYGEALRICIIYI